MTLALTLLAAPAFAVCGDVNDSGDVTATDALMVLQKAVGQNVTLTCTGGGTPTTSTTTTTLPSNPVTSEMRFRHLLTCGGRQFTATLSANSPGGKFSRTAYTAKYSSYQRLYSDNTPFSGFRMTTPTCGTVTWDGSVDVPKGIFIRAQVTATSAGVALNFYNEGPLDGRATGKAKLIGSLLGDFE